jgi:hypothetical protein
VAVNLAGSMAFRLLLRAYRYREDVQSQRYAAGNPDKVKLTREIMYASKRTRGRLRLGSPVVALLLIDVINDLDFEDADSLLEQTSPWHLG